MKKNDRKRVVTEIPDEVRRAIEGSWICVELHPGRKQWIKVDSENPPGGSKAPDTKKNTEQ
jgi:hypothetical protein